MEPQQALQPYGAPANEAKALPFQPPARVIGRNGELATVYSLSRSGAAALLWGPPGAGKSTLAAVVASAYLGGKQGSVLWLNAPDDNLDHLVARIGRAFGADTFSTALGDRARHIKAARSLLTKNRPLVVLDGIVDLAIARDFVQGCAVDIPLILTADEDGAGPWNSVELRPLTDADAQETFRYYSGLREAAFQPDIAGLCRALDGWPLTVELTARLAAVEDLAPAEILNLIPAGTRDSLETVLAIIFDRLNPAVQGVALVLAAAFGGTATPELITDLSNIPADRVAPLMRQLVLRGLARETRSHTERAFTLHEAVQRYALARLRSNQKLDVLEMRTLQTVLDYAQRHATDDAADRDRLAAEMDNVLAAAAYATSHGQNDALRRLIAIFEGDAAGFVEERGFQPELEELHNLLRLADVEAPHAAPVREGTRPVPPEVHPIEATMPVALRPSPEETRSMSGTQTLQSITGETALSPVDVEQTKILAPLSDDTLPAPVVEPPAAPEVPPGTSTEEVTLFSLDTLHAQLEEAREAKDQVREAPILQTIGRYHIDHDEPAGAVEAYRNALRIFEERNDRDGLASTLDALATLALERGDTEQALDFAQRGVTVAENLGDQARLGHLLMSLAEAQAARGLPALETYTRATEILRSAEDWNHVGISLERMGEFYLAQGQSREALMLLEQALVIFHRQNMLDHEVATLIRVGTAYASQDLGQLAREFYDRAVFLARESFNRAGEARALAAIAALHRASNEVDDLKRHLRQALYAAFLAGDSAQRATYARELGLMMVDDTRTLAQGVELLREASASDPADTEVQRLLHRAETRLQRLTAAGSAPPPAEGAALEYAALAYSV